MKLSLLLIGIVLLAGCISPKTKGIAQVAYTLNKRGVAEYTVSVQSPDAAKTSGKIKIQGHTLTVETGVSYQPESVGLEHLPYLGVGLIILGIVLLGLRHVFFFMPNWLGIAISGVGLLVVLLPELITRYLGVSYLIFWIAIFLFLCYWLYRHRMDALTKGQLIQGIEAIKDQEPSLYEKIKPILLQYQDASVKAEVAKTKASLMSRI